MRNVLEIGQRAALMIADIIEAGKADLAKHGIEKGAVVLRKSRTDATYRITRIGDEPSEYCGFYVYGQKLRMDGTYGTHEHPIGSAHDLVVLLRAS